MWHVWLRKTACRLAVAAKCCGENNGDNDDDYDQQGDDVQLENVELEDSDDARSHVDVARFDSFYYAASVAHGVHLVSAADENTEADVVEQHGMQPAA